MCFVLWNKKFVSANVLKILANALILNICSGFVDCDKIEDYLSNRAKFVTKGKGRDFQSAAQQMDEYISNPTVR